MKTAGKNFVLLGTLVLLFAVTACKKKPTEPPMPKPNITGTWEGKGTKSGVDYRVVVDLKQDDGDTTVTGSGVISALFLVIDFSVKGANVYPDVRLTFTNPSPSFGTGTYAGKFDAANDNAINGAATVPLFGITNEPLMIARIK